MPAGRFGFELLRGNAAVVSSENFRRTFETVELAEERITDFIPDPLYFAIVSQSGKPEPLDRERRFPLGRKQRRQWAARGERRRAFAKLKPQQKRFLTRRGQQFYGWSPGEVASYWNRGGPAAGIFTPNQKAIFQSPYRWENYIQRNRGSINARYGDGTAESLLSAAHRQHVTSQGGRVLQEEVAVYVVRVDPLRYPTSASQKRAEWDQLRRLRRQHGHRRN